MGTKKLLGASSAGVAGLAQHSAENGVAIRPAVLYFCALPNYAVPAASPPCEEALCKVYSVAIFMSVPTT
jgi:hypothetical protein